MTVVWRHVGITGNANGVAWLAGDNPSGTHATAVGGYAEHYNEPHPPDVNGLTATGVVPIVGTFPEYDSGTDTTYMSIGFACPPGGRLTAHVWVIY